MAEQPGTSKATSGKDKTCPTHCSPCTGYTIYDMCNCICNRPKGCMRVTRPIGVACPPGAHVNKKSGEKPKPKNMCIVPDVTPTMPSELLTVRFPSGVYVNQGNVLKPTQVKGEPHVAWKADLDTLYTVMMVDPDAPSRANPQYRYWLHWLVGNVRCNDTRHGTILAEYVGSGPPLNTGLHRYTLLVYEQKCRKNFEMKKIPNNTAVGRPNFKLKEFITKYQLGEPIAGNFYLAEYDDYVPILYIQLQL